MIEWGPFIETNRKRPEWLRPDEQVLAQDHYGRWQTRCQHRLIHPDNRTWRWQFIPGIKLPANHDYYAAAEAGFKYWPGDRGSPADFKSGSEVLFRNGITNDLVAGWTWQYEDKGDLVIVGYTASADDLPPDWAMLRAYEELYGPSNWGPDICIAAIKQNRSRIMFARLIASKEEDPLLAEAREIEAAGCEANGFHDRAAKVRAAQCDTDGPVEAILKGIRRGIEIGRRR